ncbi:MAG: 50S ribosomal protein L4 [Simkaniaceae bacterium]|jgi:large subunit ribosomal protein L4|nr:MAG: 50S ribosomal protein L4 [Simkaniaceae bacterium]
MAAVKLKKYDLEGKELEEVSVDEKLLKVSVNQQLIKDYVVAVRKNARQWSANTKGRSEIALSNSKPHPQKGTGRARQGCIKTSQYRKGAVVFGPKPKFDQHVKINKKERRAAIHFLLAQKVTDGNMRLLKLKELKEPKTKSVCKFLDAAGLKDKKVLFLCDDAEKTQKERSNFYLSMRNIPGTRFMPIGSISGYDLMRTQEVVVIDSAQKELMQAMGSK